MDLKTLLGTITRLKKVKVSKNPSEAKEQIVGLKDINNINKINSIKGKARQSIAQYPVLISENVSSKISPILTHALEVEYATLVSMIIQNTASYDTGDVQGVIGTFHKENDVSFLCGTDNKESLYEANKELMKLYNDQFNMKSLNESYYTRDMIMYLSEADDEYAQRKRNREEAKYRRDEEDRDTKRERDAAREEREEAKHRRDEAKNQREADDYESKRKRPGANVLTQPKDISKMNDLQPTVLNVEVNFTNDKGNVISKTISVGVKCVSHLLKADDIEYYLTKAAYKNNIFLKLIKFTTGEIKFWKDLMFALDDIKKSAKYATADNSKDYFYNLEYVAKQARNLLVAGVDKSNLPTATTTLIISTTDVDNIKYKNGIDILKDVNSIKKIFNTYFLLNILIVDEALEVVYVYDSESNTLQNQSFKSFEEASKKRELNVSDLYKILK